MRSELKFAALTVWAAIALSSCAPTFHTTEAWEAHKPKTVLVLPPENTTSNTEVLETAYPFLSTNLAMRGYYVIAPELALQVFEANKLNDPGQVNLLPPQKFHEVFGVDAIIRTKVTEWSSKYMVVTSTVNVGFDQEMIDTKSGLVIWKWSQTLSQSPNNGNNSLLGAMVNAAVHAATAPYEPVANLNSASMMQTVPEGVYGAAK